MQVSKVFAPVSYELGYLLLSVAEQRFGCAPAQMTEQQRREAERIALRQAEIEQRILASDEAVAVMVPASEVQTALDRIRARYTDASEFERELSANDLDLDSLRDALTRELRVEAVLARVGVRTPPVDETEARLYYYMHADQFAQPEKRFARHILITINPTYPENQREAALHRAKMIAKRLARNPDRFAEQAMKHSECPTALQGGEIGRVKRGSLHPELDTVLFQMREGTVSDVVESEVGFHVLLCEKIYAAGIAPPAEVLPKLLEQMQERAVSRAQKRWVEQLLKNH